MPERPVLAQTATVNSTTAQPQGAAFPSRLPASRNGVPGAQAEGPCANGVLTPRGHATSGIAWARVDCPQIEFIPAGMPPRPPGLAGRNSNQGEADVDEDPGGGVLVD